MNQGLFLDEAAKRLHLDEETLLAFIEEEQIRSYRHREGLQLNRDEVDRFQPILDRKVALLLCFACLANGTTLPARLNAEMLDGVLLVPHNCAKIGRRLVARISATVLESGEATNVTAMLPLTVKKLGYEGEELGTMVEMVTRMQQTFRAMMQLTQLPMG